MARDHRAVGRTALEAEVARQGGVGHTRQTAERVRREAKTMVVRPYTYRTLLSVFMYSVLFPCLVLGQSNLRLRNKTLNRGCSGKTWNCPDTGDVTYSLSFEKGFFKDSIKIFQSSNLVESFIATSNKTNGYAGTSLITSEGPKERIEIVLNKNIYYLPLNRQHCYVHIRKKCNRLKAKSTKCLWKLYM